MQEVRVETPKIVVVEDYAKTKKNLRKKNNGMNLKSPVRPLHKFPDNFEVRQLQMVNDIDYDVIFKHSLNEEITSEDFEKLLKVAEKGLMRLKS